MIPEVIRVLYADDEPSLLEIAKIFLEKDGAFAVDTFTSASQALVHLEKERYDVIISDYQMPEMDGISFLRQLRTAGNETAFIIFTGRGREEVVIEALNEGADFYLQKGGEPVAQFRELEHKIRHAISRRAAVRALKKSERDYRHLITHANEAIYIVQDQMLRMVNPKLAEMTGYTEEELMAHPMTAFIHPDDRQMLTERYERRIRGESVPNRYTFRLLRKDGTVCWVELSVVVITWDERPAVLVFLTDISERKRAEDALREREERYRQFFKTTLDCVFITTPEGRWIDFNDALVEMFGYVSRDEMFEIPVPSIYAHPEERSEFLKTVIREGYVKERPLQFRKRDGTIFDSLITIVPLRNPDGSVNAFIGTFRDITERKRAEEALRESEERYRQFFKTTRDSVFITTPDGHWIDCNDALVETLGYNSRQEIMEIPVVSVYANRDERSTFLPRVEAEGYVKEYPIQFRKRDGTVFEALITIVPQKNPDGSLKAFIGTVRDITEHKRVGEALRASEERYRYIFETFEDLYYQTDLDGAITILSPSLFRLTGWEEEELLGKPATILYSNPEERTILLNEIARNGFVRDYEIHLLKRDGTETPVSVSASRIYDADGKPAGVAGILRDITQRKRAEEALKESEEKFRTVVEYCLEAILILGLDGKILFANNAAARTIEFDSNISMTGRNVMEFIAPESRQDVLNDFIQISQGHDAYIAHYDVISAKGNRICIESLGKVITYGGVPADLVSIRDVTEQKKAHEAILEANRKLSLMNSITRHDMANQLTILRGYARIAMMRDNDPVVSDFMQKIEASADTISRLIEFTKTYQELGIHTPAWFGLDETIRKVQRPEVSVSGTCRSIEIYADPMLERVFFNLFENAFRHGERVSHIAIRCERAPDGMVIIVEDDGIGIPPEDKERIFDKGVGKNTGYGLFLAQEILAITGLSIRETGYAGIGARFEITLPDGKWRYAASGVNS